jgi:hypothetical protein
MGGGCKYLVDRPGFHQTAGIHHRDAVGDLAGHADVVRDEDDRHSQFPLQLPEQQQHLDLHRGIERGRGVVGEQKLGSARQGKRDHGALAQAARQLVRIGVKPARGGGDLHQLEQVKGAPAGRRARHMLVHAHVLGDLLPDREGRIERGRGLLKDHRHQRAADAEKLARRQCPDVDAGDPDLAAHARRRRQQADQRAQGHAFAGTGFAHQAQHFAGPQREAHAVEQGQIHIA